jgi:hypothetical protein
VDFARAASEAGATITATGYVQESDPGTPATGGRDGDAGESPASHYQFKVKGVTYDGWIKDELAKGEAISIRYNPSDPSFNHAEDDHGTFLQIEKSSLILLLIVAVALVSLLRNKGPASTT